MKKQLTLIFAAAILLSACNSSSNKSNGNNNVQAQAQKYLDAYNAEYQRLSIASNEASWKSNPVNVLLG